MGIESRLVPAPERLPRWPYPVAPLLFALAIWASGCASPWTPAPTTPRRGHHAPSLRAGVALTDITPPPGLALFGHGPEGRVAAGVLLRLQCRAFVLTQEDDAVALVVCDLAAPSLALQRAIAERVVASGLPLGADRILLMATHTHAGPAHYFEAKNYADAFSGRLTGYDDEVVDWLAERAATAIERAWAGRVPACAGWSDEPIRGLTRNRSYAAFAANARLPPELADAVRHQTRTPSDGDAPRWSPIELAVDPTLSLLRIDDCRDLAHPTPLGALAVFGVHPTAVPNTNDLYHGDLIGYAVREAERQLAPACVGEGPTRRCPLVAVANGIEGDVSASWGHQAPREARRLGHELAGHIVQIHERAAPQRVEGPIVRWTDTLSTHFPIRTAYRELRLPGALVEGPFFRDLCNPLEQDDLCFSFEPPEGPQLCQEGALGTPAAGGAVDGPTRLRVLPQMNQGQRAPRPKENPCHAEKMRLMPPFSAPHEDEPLAEEAHAFPTVAPISLVQLGDRLLATLPAEPTTVVGVRLRRRLESFVEKHVSGERAPRVVVVGLTNSWLQYLATRDEYAAQHYEGASTLYGPDSERFFSNQLLCLANWLYGDQGQDEACRLGQTSRLSPIYPTYLGARRKHRLPEPPDDLPEVIELEDPKPMFQGVDGLSTWQVSWRGVPASFLQTPRSIRVRVVASATGELFDDSDGSSIQLRHRAGRWSARWYPELRPGHPACNRRAHFEIDAGTRLRSASFLVLCDNATADTTERRSP